MFQPSQADVRRFFCAIHAKQRGGLPLDAMELVAAPWIAEHPEYHDELTDAEFEELIRPAFRDDEWILITVGALLGFWLGELQVVALERLT